MVLQPAKLVRLANGRPSPKLPRTTNAMAIVRPENIPTSLDCPVTVNANCVRRANGRPSLKLPRTPNAMAIVRLENIPTSLACPVMVNANCARAGIMAQRQVPPSAWRTQMAPTARKSVQLLRLRPPNAPLARTAHAMVLHRVNIVLWVLMEPRKVWLV
jgi:hypothetical protein